MKIEQYYRNFYPSQQLESDLDRADRLRFLFPTLPTGRKILSVGCGPCIDIAFLAGQNEVHGVDLSREALDHAQSLGIQTHQCDVSEPLDFPPASFDLIIATDILEHLFDPEATLRELGRLLKPDGKLIVSVPNHFYWEMRLRILRGRGLVLPFHDKSTEWDYFHIRFFTPNGFERLLATSGLSIIRRHYSAFRTVPRGLPSSLDEKLARRFPSLFSLHFLVECRVNLC